MTPSLNWIPARRDLWLPLAGLTPLVAVFASRGASVLAAIAFAAFIAGRLKDLRGAIARGPRLPAVLIALFAAWGAISAAWSLSPFTSIAKAATVLGIGLAALLMTAEAVQTPVAVRRLAGVIAVASSAGAAAILLTAAVAGRTSLRWLHPSGPWDDNWVNRPATTLVLYTTVAAAFLATAGRRSEAAALTALTITTAIASTSQSAALAAMLAVAVFALCAIVGRRATPILVGFVCIVAVITPFAGLALPRLGIDGLDLPRSFVHRIEIWHFASGLALDRWPAGLGLDAYRNIAELTPVRSLWSLHPHNLVLQLWVETGVPGIALAAAAVIYLLLAIGRMDPAGRPYAQAGVFAALTIAGLAWGAWQGWWLSSLALFAVLLAAIPPTMPAAQKESPRRSAGARVVTGRIDDRSVE